MSDKIEANIMHQPVEIPESSACPYQAILNKPETEEFNNIDKAYTLLDELLNDPDQLLGDDASDIIHEAMELIK